MIEGSGGISEIHEVAHLAFFPLPETEISSITHSLKYHEHGIHGTFLYTYKKTKPPIILVAFEFYGIVEEYVIVVLQENLVCFFAV